MKKGENVYILVITDVPNRYVASIGLALATVATLAGLEIGNTSSWMVRYEKHTINGDNSWYLEDSKLSLCIVQYDGEEVYSVMQKSSSMEDLKVLKTEPFTMYMAKVCEWIADKAYKSNLIK